MTQGAQGREQSPLHGLCKGLLEELSLQTGGGSRLGDRTRLHDSIWEEWWHWKQEGAAPEKRPGMLEGSGSSRTPWAVRWRRVIVAFVRNVTVNWRGCRTGAAEAKGEEKQGGCELF